MKEHLKSLYASGGGDGPEGVTAGMKAALELDWRQNAAKMAVLIADAPCHGIGEYGDGFPDRSPDGEDPLLIARQMAQVGIPLVSCKLRSSTLSPELTGSDSCNSQFVVACEPALSGYQFGLDFFRGEFSFLIRSPITQADGVSRSSQLSQSSLQHSSFLSLQQLSSLTSLSVQHSNTWIWSD